MSRVDETSVASLRVLVTSRALFGVVTRVARLREATGNALAGMAAIALAKGDTREAERLVDEATSSLQQAGPWFLHLGLYVRAILAVRRGEPDEAIAVMRESLEYVRQLRDKFAFVYALVPLSAAAILRGDDAWGARILGARDAITERTGTTVVDKSVHDLRDRAESEVRARLGPDRWERAYAAGRVTSIDSLINDIDRTIEKGGFLHHQPGSLGVDFGVTTPESRDRDACLVCRTARTPTMTTRCSFAVT